MAPPDPTSRQPSGHSRHLDAQGRARRARVAANLQHHPDRPELVADDLRQLRADKLARDIKQMVDGWPPLSAAQRSRLTVLLWAGASEGGGDEAT